MKLKLHRQAFEGEWFDYNEEVSFFIKPVGYFDITIPASAITEADRIKHAELSLFTQAIQDWKGVEGDDGALECNDKNKKELFNYFQDIRIFVSMKLVELQDKITGELKN